MSSPRLEAFLAQLYTNRAMLECFLADPIATCRDAGLDEAECAAMQSIDVAGLKMAAASFAHKRARKSQHAYPRPA